MLNGRTVIFTNYREVNDDNIKKILLNAYPIHQQNVGDMEYLFNYFKGLQPIKQRVKKVRPEIKNMIVENHANSIVQFKTGYLLEKPIQYVARKEETNTSSLTMLNDNMEMLGKESKDKEIANNSAIFGTTYRLSLPNKGAGVDESLFSLDTIDPRQAFIIYSSDIGNKPLVAVVILIETDEKGNDVIKLQAWTKDKFYIFNYTTLELEKTEQHIFNGLPLVEYPFNKERMGAFEVVIDLLDALNTLASNRLDGVEQFIQAILVFKNVEVSKEIIEQLKELGAITITDTGEIKANVEYLQQELNQEQVQTFKNDILDMVYYICGMPTRNQTSGDDSGTAVIMRDGWSEAEARTQENELMFKASEKQILKVVLGYMRTLTKGQFSLSLPDIEIKFTRRNYENLYQKAQVLDTLLKNGQVEPRLAFVVCGLFSDPETAYLDSKKYVEEMEKKQDVVS